MSTDKNFHTPETLLHETPGLPVAEAEDQVNPSNIFVLDYRRNSDILQLNFEFKRLEGQTPRDHFRNAVERGKLHCERMRYRFLFCTAYITDLELAETRRVL